MKEKKEINVEVGQNIKRIRESCGLTQERFAEMLGLGVKHISAIECGAVGVSLTTLKRICSSLSVPADTLLFGPAERTAERSAQINFLTERLLRLSDNEFNIAKDILDKLFEAFAQDK